MSEPTYPPNNPMEKYSYSFKGEPYCSCKPPCGDDLLVHCTVDADGREWVDMGKYFGSREEVLSYIVDNKLPTEYTSYVPYGGAQLKLT